MIQYNDLIIQVEQYQINAIIQKMSRMNLKELMKYIKTVPIWNFLISTNVIKQLRTNLFAQRLIAGALISNEVTKQYLKQTQYKFCANNAKRYNIDINENIKLFGATIDNQPIIAYNGGYLKPFDWILEKNNQHRGYIISKILHGLNRPSAIGLYKELNQYCEWAARYVDEKTPNYLIIIIDTNNQLYLQIIRKLQLMWNKKRTIVIKNHVEFITWLHETFSKINK